MSGSAYTMEVRLIMCRSCGGPIDAALEGGVVRCRYCSVQSEVVARARLPAFNPYAAPQISEAERMRRLRSQTGQELLPPPGIAALIGAGGVILPNRQQEALAAWQSARVRTAEQQSLEAADELEFLSLVLLNQFTAAKDWARHRAMLESALEAFFLPRHRSCAAADLCAGACNEGDLVAARRWLELCDPASDDLRTDSEYRVARARLSLAESDFQGVLAAVGRSWEEIPVHESVIGTIAVHRANALERLGDLASATNELVVQMAKSPQARATVETIVRIHGRCPQSFPPALENVVAQSAEVGARLAGGSAVKLVRYAIVFFVLDGLAIVGGYVAVFVMGRGDLLILCAAAAVTLGIIGGALVLAAQPARAEAEKARRLAFMGVRATGTVTSVTPTGKRSGGATQIRVRVRVDREGVASYEAEMKLILAPIDLAKIIPGAELPIRVSPTMPTEIALEA